jgi:TetR/AcrR family transcriptional regulator, repressor for uid operon
MRKVDPILHGERRAQVVRAALACFRRRGFAATTTAEIAREAGMSPGHVFHFFKSKDEIVAAVAEADQAQAAGVVQQLADSDDLVSALLEAAEAETDLGEYGIDGRLGLELHAEATRNARVADILRGNYRSLQAGLREAIARGQERGTIDPTIDPEGSAILVTALFEGLERAAATDPELNRQAAGAALNVVLKRMLMKTADAAEGSPPRKSVKVRAGRSLSGSS